MGRMVTISLCLIIFFLVGTIFGIKREEAAPLEQDVSSEMMDKNVIEYQEIQTYHLENDDETSHFTQKIASFLENIVTTFYELIIHVMYNISLLFF